MAKYGIPFMGSKASIVEKMLEAIPPAENFYDLFGGGLSVSHCAVGKFPHKWKHIHYNEIDSSIVDLINRAVSGDFSYDWFAPPWVSREDFLAKKASDAYVRVCWSFGNNQKDYLFGKSIEDKKRSGHMAVVFEEIDEFAREVLEIKSWKEVGLSGPDKTKERRLFWRKTCFGKKTRGLQQLEQLERLQQLEQLDTSAVSYDEVLIRPNSVIYCDIPYHGTSSYQVPFDRERFLSWAAKHESPVFVSEYAIEHKGLTEIWSMPKVQKLCATKTRRVYIEKLYANEAAVELWDRWFWGID